MHARYPILLYQTYMNHIDELSKTKTQIAKPFHAENFIKNLIYFPLLQFFPHRANIKISNNIHASPFYYFNLCAKFLISFSSLFFHSKANNSISCHISSSQQCQTRYKRCGTARQQWS